MAMKKDPRPPCKEVRQFIVKIREQYPQVEVGWGGKHPWVRLPGMKRKLAIPATPGDWRSLRNTWRKLQGLAHASQYDRRRNGLTGE